MSYFQNLYKVGGKTPLVQTSSSDTTYIVGYDISANCKTSDLSYTLFNATTGSAYQYQGVDALVAADCYAHWNGYASGSSYTTATAPGAATYGRVICIGGGGGGGGGRKGAGALDPSFDGGGGGGSGGVAVSPAFRVIGGSTVVHLSSKGAGGAGHSAVTSGGGYAGNGVDTSANVTDADGNHWIITGDGGKGGENGYKTQNGSGGDGGSASVTFTASGSTTSSTPTQDYAVITGKRGDGHHSNSDRTGQAGGTTNTAEGTVYLGNGSSISNVLYGSLAVNTSHGDGGKGGDGDKSGGGGHSSGSDGTGGAIWVLWYTGNQPLQARSSL